MGGEVRRAATNDARSSAHGGRDRDIMADPLPLGASGWSVRAGELEVRLSQNAAEVAAAQALRYQIFYEELAAKPTPDMARDRRDFDDFDRCADHLLVLDHTRGQGAAGVVGTYRLIRRAAAAEMGSFYTAHEYDIRTILDYPGEILELGRSCVGPNHRSGQVMQLLWRGIAAYVFEHDVKLMFGCASLHGIELSDLALPLSYLFHHHLAPPSLRPLALADRRSDMNLVQAQELDVRRAAAALPPLIKGYLRLGGKVGDGAVIDRQFHTTDVCVVVKTDLVTEKYYKHYERQQGRADLPLSSS